MAFESIDKAVLYRMAFVLAGITIIIWGCTVVLMPFIPALLLAVILCLSTWPAFKWLEARLGGRKGLAALLMTFCLAICFLVPLLFLGSSLADNFGVVYRMILSALDNNDGTAPAWMAGIPFIGVHMNGLWHQYLSDTEKLTTTLSGYAGPISTWLLGFGAAIGRGVLDISLGVLIAFFLFRHGAWAGARLNALIDRFAGERGQHLLTVSKKTMVGVVYGLLGTALVQGTLAGVGFWIAHVPGAPFLGLLTFVVSFIPLGPPLIWGPAAVWLYMHGYTGMAIFLALWGLLVVSAIDNIIRPYFISLGSSLPLLLVLLGVFGGIIAFGFIGLFIGPVLLALAYTLMVEWSHGEKTVIITPPV